MLFGGGVDLAKRRNTMKPHARTAAILVEYKSSRQYVCMTVGANTLSDNNYIMD